MPKGFTQFLTRQSPERFVDTSILITEREREILFMRGFGWVIREVDRLETLAHGSEVKALAILPDQRGKHTIIW